MLARKIKCRPCVHTCSLRKCGNIMAWLEPHKWQQHLEDSDLHTSCTNACPGYALLPGRKWEPTSYFQQSCNTYYTQGPPENQTPQAGSTHTTPAELPQDELPPQMQEPIPVPNESPKYKVLWVLEPTRAMAPDEKSYLGDASWTKAELPTELVAPFLVDEGCDGFIVNGWDGEEDEEDNRAPVQKDHTRVRLHESVSCIYYLLGHFLRDSFCPAFNGLSVATAVRHGHCLYAVDHILHFGPW